MMFTSAPKADFDDLGYVVHEAVVEPVLTTAALRLLNGEVARLGLSAEEIREGGNGTFFPHLRWNPEILAIQEQLTQLVAPATGEQWADPQLLLRFPDDDSRGQPWAHLDEPPLWANGRRYRVIAGVALNDSRSSDGCLAVWPRSHRKPGRQPALVELAAGDVVLMHPRLWHAPTLNIGPCIRYATYFRLLTA